MPIEKIASLYVVDEAGWVEFDDSLVPLLDWDNERLPGDQTVGDIRQRLHDECLLFLERKHGYLPPRTIEIRDEFDGADNVYLAYYQY